MQFSGPCNHNKGFWKFAKLLGGKKVNWAHTNNILCKSGVWFQLRAQFLWNYNLFSCPLDFVWIKRTNIISLFFDRPCTFCNLVQELMLSHNECRLLLQWSRWGNTISMHCQIIYVLTIDREFLWSLSWRDF